MIKLLKLTRVLLKSGIISGGGGKRDSRRIIAYIVLAVVMIPFMIGYAVMMAAAYPVLSEYQLTEMVLSAVGAALVGIMILLGFFYVISIYYYADDTVSLITMPLKPEHILISKFIVVMLYQYIMEAIFFLPPVIGFGIQIHTVAYVAYAIVILVLFPMIPTAVCSLLSIILMAFGRFFRNKDRMKVITGIIGIGLAVGINVFVQLANNNSAESTAQLISGQSGVINGIANVFASSRLISGALLNSTGLSGFLYLLGFLLATFIAFIIFIFAGRGLYLKGLIGLTQSSASGKALSEKRMEKLTIKRSKMFAYALKDWRIVFRTPSFFINCVLTGIVFPPLMTVIFCLSIGSLQSSGLGETSEILGFGSVIITVFCLMNMIAPTSISREGKDLFISRYVPVSPKTQILGKLLPGVLMSWASLILVSIVAVFFVKFSFQTVAMIFIVCLLSLLAANLIGIFLDICMPKINWDNETEAVKRNFNSLIEMATIFGLFFLLIILANLLKLGVTEYFILLLFAFAAVSAAMSALIFTKGARIYSRIEN